MKNLHREAIAALLKQHASALDIQIVSTGPNYRYDLEIDGKRYRAVALSSSRHYYDYRLHLISTSPIEMLVVGAHDTRTSLPVLALDEGYFYAPYEAPRWYEPDAVRTRKDAMVVIGGLISGVEEEYTRLNQMKRTTRYRYLAQMNTYLSLKQGRQLVV